MTPEQYRALADGREEVAATWYEYTNMAAKFREDATALRAAADQLEAVQELHRWLRKSIGSPALHERLAQFATAEADRG